uniref:EF-hand domain-containing protein n=1 Tax=Panagrolaimus davidi TaxID=227884 RepID=A0A914P5E6_9BILA
MKVEEEKDRVYELFSAFDSTHDNTIAVSEVPVLIRVLGLAIKESDIKPLLKNWTDKNEERVTYEDFLPVYHALKEKYDKKANNPTTEQFISILSLYDYQGQGIITQQELSRFLGHGTEGLSEREINNLFHSTSALGNEIGISDFVRSVMEDQEIFNESNVSFK